jgi:uncharacterized protein (TIGR03437 family)
VVTLSGVLHAASRVAGAPIAPGSLINIAGPNVANGSPNTTTVMLGSRPVPILSVSDGQLTVQAPFDIPITGQQQLTVQSGSMLSVPVQLVAADAQPGIFTLNQQGAGPGLIYNSDGVTLTQDSAPSVGDTISIYAAGLGQVSQDGTGTVINDVSVTIDGHDADVNMAVLAPGGQPGWYQINAVVPDGADTGEGCDVPVQLTVKVTSRGSGADSSLSDQPPVFPSQVVSMRRPHPKGGTGSFCTAQTGQGIGQR